MKNKAVHFWRWSLILVCAIICAISFVYMNQFYDPLARYPYASDYNRDIILEHLSSDDIEYIVSQQIKPGQFIPFVNTEDFNIRNSVFYTAAYDARKGNRQEIVNFVNRYKKYFTLDSIKTYLKYYTYADLINFIETQLVLHPGLVLVEDPEYEYLVLDGHNSVYKYEPQNLRPYDGKPVKEVMIKELKAMMDDYAGTMKTGIDRFVLDYGTLSYEEVLEQHAKLTGRFKTETDKLFWAGGQNEAQLGYTITLAMHEDWLDLLEQHPSVFKTYNYAQLFEEGQDSQEQEAEPAEIPAENEAKQEEEDGKEIDLKLLQQTIDWLEDNSWKYGFIIRYPKSDELITGHIWQPFVLRYVGADNAKGMHEKDEVMETYDFKAS